MRYKVDLKGFMADCELNYQRLRQLCPASHSSAPRTFVLAERSPRQRAGQEECQQNPLQRHFVITRVERTPYTTLVEIAEQTAHRSPLLSLPTMRVRLYHDARLAEVVEFSRVRRAQPRYHYPNRRMHQRDEKAQWNRFLAEWLSIVADTGYAVSHPFVAID